jgi:hypothetical protein
MISESGADGMAIVTAVKERTQSRTAMVKVIRYVSQDKKTLYENEGRSYKLLSGQDCCGETAFQEFMETKRQYNKEKGVFFYQYVQSFKPNEKATPDEIHQMGEELAKYFKGYEVLIATHIDRDHWHNHLIVNSVNCETGLKLQFNEKNLKQLRTMSDQICMAHGLEILKPYEKPALQGVHTGEYRAAVSGNSWKFRLMSAIDRAMVQSRTKSGFIAGMEQMGYGVKWMPNYKYITYTTPEGQKCRDNRLHEENFLKERMEELYAEHRGLEEAQQSDRDIEPAVSSADMRDTQGAMGGYAQTANRDSEHATGTDKHHRQAADRAGLGANYAGFPPERISRPDEYAEQPDLGREPEDRELDGYELSGDDGYDGFEDDGGSEESGEYAPSPGYVGTEAQSKVVQSGDHLLGDVVSLAKAVEDMVNPYDPETERQKKKAMAKSRNQHKKKIHDHSDDYDISL